MAQYETGFIVSPTLPEEEAGRLIQQMAEVVAQKKGRMVKQDVWGKRRLAYAVKRFHEGVYVFFTYEGGGEVPLELERRFKQTDAVIRFLTVKKDPRDLLNRRKKKTPPEAAPAAPAEPAGAAPEEK